VCEIPGCVAHIKCTASISGPLCGARNRPKEDDRHHLNCWPSDSSAIWRITSYLYNCSAWRSLLLQHAPSDATYTTLWTCRQRVVVRDVLCPDPAQRCAGCISVLYALWGCIPPNIKVLKNTCDVPQASPHHALRSLSTPSSAQWLRTKKRGRRHHTRWNVVLWTHNCVHLHNDVCWTASLIACHE